MKDFSYGSEKCGEQQKHKRLPGTKQLYNKNNKCTKLRVMWYNAKSTTGKFSIHALQIVSRTEKKQKQESIKKKKYLCFAKIEENFSFSFIQVIASAFGRSQWKK